MMETLLTEVCDTVTVAYTRGVAGGQVKVETTSQTGLPCRVKEMKPEDVAVLAKDGVRANYKIYFASDPAVGKRDVIVWNGLRLEVTAWYNPHNLGRMYKVYAYVLKDD